MADEAIVPRQRDASVREFVKSHGELARDAFLARFPTPFLLTAIGLDPGSWDYTGLVAVRKRTAAPDAAPSDPVTIGRAAENDIVAAFPSVSKKHAVLTPSSNGWNITDLGSSNGTSVNGRQVPSGDAAAVASMTRIQLGPDAQFIFVTSSDLWGYLQKAREVMSADTGAAKVKPRPAPAPKRLVDLSAVSGADTVPAGIDAREVTEFARVLEAVKAMGPLVERIVVTLKLMDQKVEVPYEKGKDEWRSNLAVLRPLAKKIVVRMQSGDERTIHEDGSDAKGSGWFGDQA